jgi:hypothetical protein
MKNRAILWMIAGALLAASCGTTKNAGGESAEKDSAWISNAVTQKHFKVEVSRAYPQGGQLIPLTSLYSLTVRGDSVYSYLPYFGRAYRVPYSGSVGLNFNGVMTDYRTYRGRRGETIAKFNLASPEDRHEYTVEIEDNGVSTIRVNSLNRQSIDFEGRMERD